MFKIKWDLKPLSLNKNLKKVRLLRDLRLQASSNNGKRPCSNINITSNIKCYLNHVCRSKIKSGLCAACPRCPEEPFKTSHVANMWLPAQYVGSIAYLVWGVRVRIPSKSEFTQASTELQRYSSQQIFDLQEDNRYMTLHCHLRGRFLPLEGDLCHILAARKSILTQFFLKIKMRRIEEGDWMNMNERNINWYSLVRIQSKNAVCPPA